MRVVCLISPMSFRLRATMRRPLPHRARPGHPQAGLRPHPQHPGSVLWAVCPIFDHDLFSHIVINSWSHRRSGSRGLPERRHPSRCLGRRDCRRRTHPATTVKVRGGAADMGSARSRAAALFALPAADCPSAGPAPIATAALLTTMCADCRCAIAREEQQ